MPGGKPAGAFYFYVADPLVESASDAAEAVESEMRKLFRLRGITLCDVEILEAMDKGEEAFAGCRLSCRKAANCARARRR